MAGSIELGIAPIAWSNDDLPALGGDTPLEVCLKESRQAGFSGIEKGGKCPLDPKILAPLLAEHDLKLISGWFSGELRERSMEAEKQRIAAQLDLYQALDCPVMIYAETTNTVQNLIETPVSQRPVMSDDQIKFYGEKLTSLADWLLSEGCPLSYHHHMGTVIETEEEIDRLMAASDQSVGLLLDTGHLTFAGGDVLATTQRHGHRINHVHGKDIRTDTLETLKSENWSFLKGVLEGVFTVPGDGSIDFHIFAKALAAIGYNGWVVVEAEQDPAKAAPLEMAEIGHRTLTKAFEAAGFEIKR